MTILRIFIDDISPKEYEWLLFDNAHAYIKGNKDTLNNMPFADEVEVVVPTEWVSFTPTTLPIGNRRKVLEALPYLIEEHLITNPELVKVIIAEALPNNRAILASIDKQTIDNIIKLLDSHRIYARKLYPASAITRPDVDTWIIVSDRSEYFLCTTAGQGIALSREEDDLPPVELRLALQQSQNSALPPSKIIVYGNNNLKLKEWSAELSLPVLPDSTDWKKLSHQSAMNFLQGEFAPASPTWEILSQAKPAFSFLMATIVLCLIGTSVDWAYKAYQINQLDKQMKTLFLTTFPDTTNVVDAHLQMQRKLSELQHATGEYEDHDFLPLLAKLSKVTGGLANLNALDYKKNQLRLSIQADNEKSASALSQKISTSGLPNTIENITSKAGNVNFDLVFNMAGGE